MHETLTHEHRVTRLAELIRRHDPQPGPPSPCAYLSGRAARHLTIVPQPCAPGFYHALMDLNFRRLGEVYYRPQCVGCRECRMLRVSVAAFVPSRAQRRCLKRNADLRVVLGPPTPQQPTFDLYRRYLAARHDGQMAGSREEYESFLHTSAIETIEVRYALDGRVVAVAIVDVEPQALSAVYCYFDPDLRQRSLGIFNVLWLIEECRRRATPHLYLGYFVRDAPKMSYKASFRPFELLLADGRWRSSQGAAQRPDLGLMPPAG